MIRLYLTGLGGMIFYKELASLRTSLFLRYNTEHIFYL